MHEKLSNRCYKNYVKLRDKRKLSDYEVAKESNIPRSVLSEWKNKQRLPQLPTLIALSKFFNVTLDELVF